MQLVFSEGEKKVGRAFKILTIITFFLSCFLIIGKAGLMAFSNYQKSFQLINSLQIKLINLQTQYQSLQGDYNNQAQILQSLRQPIIPATSSPDLADPEVASEDAEQQ